MAAWVQYRCVRQSEIHSKQKQNLVNTIRRYCTDSVPAAHSNDHQLNVFAVGSFVSIPHKKWDAVR